MRETNHTASQNQWPLTILQTERWVSGSHGVLHLAPRRSRANQQCVAVPKNKQAHRRFAPRVKTRAHVYILCVRLS